MRAVQCLWIASLFACQCWEAIATTERGDTDILVIGAGIGGAATSYFLADSGMAPVVVFERNDYIGGRLKHTQLPSGPNSTQQVLRRPEDAPYAYPPKKHTCACSV